MNQDLIVDCDVKSFIIHCPFWANDLIRELPSRRWVKSKKVWSAPITGANIRHIRDVAGRFNVVMTEPAVTAIKKYDDMMAGVEGHSFPAWYKFKRQPRKHQIRALNKGYGLNAYALFMEMQTGKSKTSIDMVCAHRMEGHIRAVLILTKLTLRNNWLVSLEDDATIPYSAHLPLTSKKKQFNDWLSEKHDFKIMIAGWESLSVGGISAMCEKFLTTHYPAAIIGDETNFIMGHKAARAQVAVRLGELAKYKYALTGTPATEGVQNLFMQFEYLDTNILGLGDYYAFRNRYCVMGGFVPKDGPMKGKPTAIVGYQNIDELMDLIGPYSFQVLKIDEYDLPPKRYKKYYIEMTKEQRDAYKKIKSGVLTRTDGEEYSIKSSLEMYMRLHQLCGGYSVTVDQKESWNSEGNPTFKDVFIPLEVVPPDKNPKMLEFKSIVEETKGKHGIVWAAYAPEIRAISVMLKGMGLRVGELHGGILEQDRQPVVKAFNNGDIDWMVCNAATGGMGYPMHIAEVNVFYSNTFKMRDRLQAEDRSWGDGQTRQGIWVDLLMEKSMDVTVMKSLECKEDVVNYIKRRIKETNALADGE